MYQYMEVLPVVFLRQLFQKCFVLMDYSEPICNRKMGWIMKWALKDSCCTTNYFDISGFFFDLKNTIVQRIDTNGVYYYVNAGSTKQNGVETYASYQLVDNAASFY